ncbi:S-methyl-5'-thioinosine phosphorylase [Candidatus Poriferisodalis sp.]|uniref:S-methyl-5'-thioinosine phosphorylase n=1 Tax=Candidatus Poriferisodalis sp. TaxID=3101277 RepID=UPI003B021341
MSEMGDTSGAGRERPPVGIIAGTGYYELPGLSEAEHQMVQTDWGEAHAMTGRWRGRSIVFVPRHGGDHSIPPSAINYRANIAAIRDLEATAILAVSVVGSMVPERGTGSFLLLDDYLEFTTGRAATFFDQPGQVTHTDMTTPYDPSLRAALVAAAATEGIDVAPTATYVCTNGPRFETPAEIRMYAQMGGSVVGMTGYPEVALAREAGIPYAGIAVVANMAAGMFDGEISHEEVSAALAATKEPLFALLGRTVSAI